MWLEDNEETVTILKTFLGTFLGAKQYLLDNFVFLILRRRYMDLDTTVQRYGLWLS